MRVKVAFLCVVLAASASAGCKKGSGGGGWLVGTEGLMIDVDDQGKLGPGYDLGASENLNAIACRYLGEAWVVGSSGTLLYTSDAGESWTSHDLGTTADLRALATQDAGPVFIAGNGVFFTASPDYTGAASWTQLGDGTASFRSLAAAQRGSTVLAIDDASGVWSYGTNALVKRATLPGAQAVAVSSDGAMAIAAGAGLHRSFDGGRTWSPLAVDPSLVFDAVRIDDSGEALAVGAGGAVARIDTEGRVLVQRLGSDHLRTVHVAPSSDYSGVGYAAGDSGQVWMTRDSGWTWTPGPNVGRTVLGVDEIGDGHN
jgi:hypothetical protein